jgi:hypothetical protein
MSTDTDGLDGVPEMFHETWAQTLEVVIGIILLSREVGWIWPLPLILIFCRFSQLRGLFVCLLLLLMRGFVSVLSYEPLCGQALTAWPESLEHGNPTPRGSDKLHAQFNQGHQDAGTTALHSQAHASSARGGVGDSIESQVDHGVLQCQRFVSVLAVHLEQS